eukprot:m.655641 g.655641  ORF g.655641 m.655641 type:complete len:58 (+) comp58422_c0_seq2:1950-2123(+)
MSALPAVLPHRSRLRQHPARLPLVPRLSALCRLSPTIFFPEHVCSLFIRYFDAFVVC